MKDYRKVLKDFGIRDIKNFSGRCPWSFVNLHYTDPTKVKIIPEHRALPTHFEFLFDREGKSRLVVSGYRCEFCKEFLELNEQNIEDIPDWTGD
jgi:hypothetical protein